MSVEQGEDDGGDQVTSCRVNFVETPSFADTRSRGIIQAKVLEVLDAYCSSIPAAEEDADDGRPLKVNKKEFRDFAFETAGKDVGGLLETRSFRDAIRGLVKRGILSEDCESIWQTVPDHGTEDGEAFPVSFTFPDEESRTRETHH